MVNIVLLSGAIASGKTTLAEELIGAHDFQRLKSSDHLKAICAREGAEISRANLQKTGDSLDIATDFEWLIKEVAEPQIASAPRQQKWLIDAVRKRRQIEHFRAMFGAQILHVHIWAPEETLRTRYDQRRSSGTDHEGSTEYSEAIAHPNEIASRALQAEADCALNVDRVSPAVAANAIMALIA